MQIIKEKIILPLSFWIGIGPFLLLLTVFLMLTHPSVYQLPLAIGAMGGLAACWLWRTKGTIFAIFFVFCLFLGISGKVPQTDHLWFLGLTLAISSLLLTSLFSIEEAFAIIDEYKTEANSHFSGFSLLQKEQLEWTEKFEIYEAKILENEKKFSENQVQVEALLVEKRKLEGQQKQWEIYSNDIENLNNICFNLRQKIDELTKENSQLFSQFNEGLKLRQNLERNLEDNKIEHEKASRTYEEKTADLQEKFNLLTDGNSKLDTQLKEAQEEHYRLSATLEELNLAYEQKNKLAEIKEIDHEKISRTYEEKIADLQERFNLLTDGNSKLDTQLKEAQEENCRLSATLEELNLAYEQKNKLAEINESELLQKLEIINHNNHDFQNQIIESHKKCEQLQASLEEIKKSAPVNSSKPYEAMYTQLRQQFEEKSAVLDKTRKELFHTQEKLTALVKEYEEKEYAQDEYSEKLIKQILEIEDEMVVLEKEQREETQNWELLVDSLIKK